MKIYLDVVFIINFFYDFITLISSSIILKRNTKLIRIILGSLFGSLTLLIYFIRMNNIEIFIYKIIISSLIIIITFNYKNIKYFIKNIYYFYLIGILLGGFLYFINNSLLKNNGLIFYKNKNINVFIGIILSVICTYIYIRNIKDLKTNYNKYLKVKLFFNNYSINLNAFLDTGNKLIDPYTLKPIIIVNKEYIKNDEYKLLVPYKTCDYDGLLKCIKANKIFIEGIGYKKNFLVGITDSIKMDGVDCILSELLMEGI